MPHCIIEYAKTLEAKLSPMALVNAVSESVLASDLFESSHIKTRAIAYDYFQIGAEKSDFIHVTVHLHKWRTSAQKKMLSSTTLKHLVDLDLSAVTITVEIVDIDTESYAKQTL